MGWARGQDVFDPVALHIVKLVAKEEMDEEIGRGILVLLIDQLQSADWDTEDESLYEFRNIPFVAQAFAAQGVHLEGR